MIVSTRVKPYQFMRSFRKRDGRKDTAVLIS